MSTVKDKDKEKEAEVEEGGGGRRRRKSVATLVQVIGVASGFMVASPSRSMRCSSLKIASTFSGASGRFDLIQHCMTFV